MSYYNPGRNRLISDILSPINRDGYNVSHPKIQTAEIGQLDKRFKRRHAYKQVKPAASKHLPASHYTVVPPLVTLDRNEPSPALAAKAGLLLASAGQLFIKSRERLSSMVHEFFENRPTWEFRQKTLGLAAIPILLALVAAVWLFRNQQPAASGARTIPIAGQLISSGSSSGASGKGANAKKNTNDSQNPASGSAAAGGTASTPSAQSAYAAGGSSGATTSGTGSTGGMGGGPVSSGGGSASGTTSGLLPMTLTVPAVNTSTPDGKTLLDSSGTTIKIN